MKIAVITEICNAHSGIRVPVEMAKRFAKNHQVTFFAYDLNTDLETKKDLQKKGVKITLLKLPKIFILGKYLGALKLHLILKKGNFDVVSLHATFPLLLASSLSGVPVVKNYYGVQKDAFLERYLPNQKPPFWTQLVNHFLNLAVLTKERLYFKFPNKTLGISKYTVKETKTLFGQKIDYLYLGGDSGVLTKADKPLKKKGGSIKILSVSRLTPYKGFHLLVKTFKKLNKKYPQAKLILAGSAPKRNYLNYLKKIKNKNVKILVNVSDKKLSRLYQECDFYATCDRYLFFGLPPVEAAHFGKPSVALNFCAAPEIIKHGQTGYLADDLSAFSYYLEKLTQNQNLRKRLGQKAKKRAEKIFLWDKIAPQHEALFKTILNKEKPPKKGKKSLLLPLALSLVISVIFGLPHLLVPYFLGGVKNYQPLTVNRVSLLTFEETWSYAAQAREVYDGHLLVADYHLAEFKNLPSTLPLLPPLLIGGLSLLTGSMGTAFILSDFLLPPITFLIIYLFLVKLTSQPLLSSLAGVLILTANRLFQFVPPLTRNMARVLWAIFTINGSETDLLEFSRLFHPQLTFVFLILYLYFLFLVLKKKTFFRQLTSAIFLASLFYSYFYYWTFALAGTVVLLLLFFAQKNSAKVKSIASIIVVALLLSIPFWVMFFNFKSLPTSFDILERNGLEPGRVRNVARSAQYLLFSFIFFILIKKKNLSFWFLLSFLLGGIACLNLQLLTGFTLQSWHWTLRAINPLTTIMLLYLFHQVLGRHRLYSPLLIGLIVLFLIRGLALHTVVAKNTYQGYNLPKTTLNAFAWLNQNTANDAVVLTPSLETNSLIPTYTHNNLFLPNGGATFASDQEIIKRLLTSYKIFNLSPEDLEKILVYSGDGLGIEGKNCQKGNCVMDSELLEKQAVTVLFHLKYLKKQESLSGWSTVFEIPLEVQQKILTAYQDILKTADFLPEHFQLNYIYYGPAEKRIKEIDFSQFDFVKEVYQNQDVRIYEIEKSLL